MRADIPPNEKIDINGKSIVFTGECRLGDTDELKDMFEKHGAVIRKSVSSKTDYLIVGDFGSPDWSYGNYGTEVVKARELQEAGKKVKIINESDFMNLISDVVYV
jgi:BRCT domain type II-containing protein